jgi:hypothetical protein
VFVKLLASFAPWIALLVIARDTVGRVEVGLAVGLVLALVMAVLRVNRGMIMWVSLAFFGAAALAVVAAQSMWTVRHLGALANGSLAVAAWAGLVLGRPFTLDYARAQTDPSLWHAPLFLRVNRQLTAVWAATFTLNAVLSWVSASRLWPEWLCLAGSYTALIATATFTSWYPAHLRRNRSAQP